MSGIKGVGKGVCDAIVIERQKGPFQSLYDFFNRIDTSAVGKKVAENLIEAGSFDFTGWTRLQMLQSVEPMFDKAMRKQKEESKGILDFFSVLGDEEKIFEKPPPTNATMSKAEVLAREKELLGFYLTGHPMNVYRDLMKELECQTFQEIETLPHGAVCKTAFIIENLKIKISAKTQRKFAILTISDGVERLELPVWPDLYEEKSELFHENKLLFAILQVEKENDSLRLRCRTAHDLTAIGNEEKEALKTLYEQTEKLSKTEMRRKGKQPQKIEKEEKKLNLTLQVDQIRFSQIVSLKKLFQSFPGDAAVHIEFHSGGRKIALVEVESKWGVGLSGPLKEALESLSFIQSFSFES